MSRTRWGPQTLDPWGLQRKSKRKAPNATADWEVTKTCGSDGLTAPQERGNRQY